MDVSFHPVLPQFFPCHTVVITPAWFNHLKHPLHILSSIVVSHLPSSSTPQALAGRIFGKVAQQLCRPESPECAVVTEDLPVPTAWVLFSISGGCGRPWGPSRDHQGCPLFRVAAEHRAGPSSSSHSESLSKRSVFRAQSPTMSHSRAPARERDHPAGIFKASSHCIDAVGGR